MQALINSNNEINAITLDYTLKLSLKDCFINVNDKKIDDSIFETFEIVITSFQVKNKLSQAQYF